ncbi:MAG: cache domain-containing protein [Campylobacterota bacterium]|nr:cache domain-containing protein [Campylobacterota bacterium]
MIKGDVMSIYTFQKKVKNNIVILILAIVVLASVINVMFIYHEQYRSVEGLLAQNLKLNNKMFYSIVKKNTLVLEKLMKNLQKDDSLLEEFARHNYNRLYASSASYYDLLTLLSKDVPNMHFYLPDSTSFLRMHRPNKHGDKLKGLRPMVEKVNRTLETQKGYELGKYGFYLQVVSPIVVDGKHVGAVGIGINISSILDELKALGGEAYLVEIEDACFNHDHANQRHLLEHLQTRHIGKGLLIGNIDATTLKKLSIGQQNNYEIIENYGKKKLINYAMPIHNFEGEYIGRLISIQDISHIYKELNASIIQVVFLTLISAMMMIFAINRGFVHFGQYIGQIYREHADTMVKLQTIHMKLNPHFIINSLNSVSALIYINKELAEKNIILLADLIRNYLGENNELSIQDELKYSLDYCELINMRHNGKHNWKVHIADKSLIFYTVPKFTIQLLVENAFKHGLKNNNALHLSIKIFKRNGLLVLSVSNSSTPVESISDGIGLKSLKHRIRYNDHNKVTWRYRCGVINFKIYLKEMLDENKKNINS